MIWKIIDAVTLVLVVAVLAAWAWDRDLAVCECGFEQKLETSTTFDYTE